MITYKSLIRSALLCFLCSTADGYISSGNPFASTDSLVIFGDSLSDQGNLFLATGGLSPSPSSYFNGRFSNGAVYTDRIPNYLGPTSPSLSGGLNFSFGGALAGDHPLGVQFSYSSQVDTYFSLFGDDVVDGHGFLIWIGSNDIISAVGTADPSTGSNLITSGLTILSESVSRLREAGATDIVLVNAPDIGFTPRFQNIGNPLVTSLASSLTQQWNAGVNQLVSEQELVLFDAAGLFDDVIAGNHGFENVVSSALIDNPDDPDTYAFWDDIHPTSAFHEIIAEQLFVTPVPEPALAPLLLGFIAVAYVRIKKRKQT